jgi:hypothetical protein
MRDVIEQKYLKTLPLILGVTTGLVVALVLAWAVYVQRAGRPTTAPLNASATVVVFETADCALCEAFRSKIGKPYRSSAFSSDAPLRFYDITDGPPPKRYQIAGEIWDIPTAVVFDVYGREVARVRGVPDDLGRFQDLVRPHVRRAERDLAYAASAKLK